MAKIARSILDLIGNTPVVKLNKLVPDGAAEVFVKLERANPGGSVKDRIALSMIREAEAAGRLTPGCTIVEPTSGNTGIGLAMVAAALGYRLILTMPDTMSVERRSLLRAYGAEIVLTPGREGMLGAIRKAEEIVAANPQSFMPQQFENPANPDVHRTTTALEIIDQMEGRLDAFVAGVGTGGTLTGTGLALRDRLGTVMIVAVEPQRSAVLSGGSPGNHGIQGIGAGFIPKVLDTSIIDRVIPVSDEEAMETATRLARQEGMLVGISSGAAAFAAIEVARELGPGKRVMALLPDTGERYLSVADELGWV